MNNINLRRVIFSGLVVAFLFGFQISRVSAQCTLVDRSRDSVFITFEKTMGKAESQRTALLRLRNNSTCAVIITTGSADKFYEPVPPKSTLQQRVRRKINYELPDNALVPEVQYSYVENDNERNSVGGDSFFGFTLLGGRSILFEVPLEHFLADFLGRITLRFDYVWEQDNRSKHNYASVRHTVGFSGLDILKKTRNEDGEVAPTITH